MRAGLMLVGNESGVARFLEFIRSVDDRELKYADDVFDDKSRIGRLII